MSGFVWVILCWFAQTSDYDAGMALIAKGDAAAAIPHLLRSATMNKTDPHAWKALGVAYATLGEYAKAQPVFQKACRLQPTLVDACYYHGRALYALDRFEQSLNALEGINSKTPKVWLAIAQAHEGLGRVESAETAYRKAEPDVTYGRFLVRQGRFQEARTLLEGLLKQNPGLADAHIQLGRALLETGAVSEAISHLEKAVARQNSAQAHLLLAKAYVRAGRATEAQPHFDMAARLEKQSQ